MFEKLCLFVYNCFNQWQISIQSNLTIRQLRQFWHCLLSHPGQTQPCHQSVCLFVYNCLFSLSQKMDIWAYLSLPVKQRVDLKLTKNKVCELLTGIQLVLNWAYFTLVSLCCCCPQPPKKWESSLSTVVLSPKTLASHLLLIHVIHKTHLNPF